jgi:translation initiation factor 2 subunit 1
MKKSGKPKRGELVICRISKLHPNSAYAKMIEYEGLTGLIHVSEVAKRWVRDIREFLKEQQYVVCRVMGAEDHTISLSIKRVHKDEANRKLNEFKREKRAEKMLEMAGKLLKKDLKQSYDEIGYKLQEEFGPMTKAFETAFKNPELLERKGIPKKWRDALITIAKKSLIEKTYTVRGKLKLICYKNDGVNEIKRILAAAGKKGMGIRYVSAPMYEIWCSGKNYKEVQAKVEEAGADIVKEIEKCKGEGSFQLVKQ